MLTQLQNGSWLDLTTVVVIEPKDSWGENRPPHVSIGYKTGYNYHQQIYFMTNLPFESLQAAKDYAAALATLVNQAKQGGRATATTWPPEIAAILTRCA